MRRVLRKNGAQLSRATSTTDQTDVVLAKGTCVREARSKESTSSRPNAAAKTNRVRSRAAQSAARPAQAIPRRYRGRELGRRASSAKASPPPRKNSAVFGGI